MRTPPRFFMAAAEKRNTQEDAVASGESLNVDFAGAAETGALAAMKKQELVPNGSECHQDNMSGKAPEAPTTNGYQSDESGSNCSVDGGSAKSVHKEVQEVGEDIPKKKTIVNGSISSHVPVSTSAEQGATKSDKVNSTRSEDAAITTEMIISSKNAVHEQNDKDEAQVPKSVSPLSDCDKNTPSEEVNEESSDSRFGSVDSPDVVTRNRSRTPVTTRSRSGTPVSTVSSGTPVATVCSGTPVATVSSGTPVATVSSGIPVSTVCSGTPVATVGSGIPVATVGSGTPVTTVSSGTTVESSGHGTPLGISVCSSSSLVSDGLSSSTLENDATKLSNDQGTVSEEELIHKHADSKIPVEKVKTSCVDESNPKGQLAHTTEVRSETTMDKSKASSSETTPSNDAQSDEHKSVDANVRSSSARSSEERSIFIDSNSVRSQSSEDRYLGSPMGIPLGSRSSEERSKDSTDSSRSKKCKTIVPKARKSGFRSSSIKKMDVLPNNFTIKLPDFDNPIQIDSRTLEKISRLGKMENKHRGAGPSKFDKHLPKKSSPKLASRLSSPILSSPSKKFHHKRRKRKLGGYKLPTEIRKCKYGKRKTDSEDGNKGSDGEESLDDKMDVDFNRSQEDSMWDKSGMDVDNEKTDNKRVDNLDNKLQTSASTTGDTNKTHIKVEADVHNTESSTLSNDMNDQVMNSSTEDVSKDANKNVWDIFRPSNATPKSKNTLGSTRSTKGLCSRKLEKITKELHQGKTMDSYLLGTHQKTSPDGETRGPESNVMTTPSAHKVDSEESRKRKIEASSDDEVSIRMPLSMSASQLPSLQQSGKKLKLEDTRRTLITVLNTPPGSMPTPTGLRSLLPRSLTGGSIKTMPKLTDSRTMQNIVTSPNPPKLIVLSNVSTSAIPVSVPQSPFISNISMVTKALPTGSTPIMSSAYCIQSNSPQQRQLELSPQGRAPVLKTLLTGNMGGGMVCLDHGDSEKENSSDSLPSSMSYPVTPPKTPDDQRNEDSCSAPPGPTPPDKDVIPLCCCKINGASFKKLGSSTTYCQALDSIDGKVMGCCNKVTGSQLVRPGVKIPFMALCEPHRKRLRQHQCCPGCGHFCTQGKFFQCKKESAISMHHFHKQCQVLKGSKYYCPHCGEESKQFEVSMCLEEPGMENLAEDKPNARAAHANRAKMSIHANTYRSFLKPEKDPSEDLVTASHKTSNDKTLSTGGVPLGPDKNALEKVINNLAVERPLKYRKLPKCMYNPAYEGDLERIIFMLVDGFNPDDKYEEFDNQTPLHAAAIGGSLPIVHLLVQAGASIHHIDKELKTPLMHAAENNHVGIVQYFLKMKADVTLRAEDGMTVLHYASKAGHVAVIKLLLVAHGIDINVQDDGGWTPIIWASEHRFVNAVRYLVKNGADPNLKDKEENTSLHWAAFSGSVDIAEIFLNAGCDLETPNEHGDRPLHIASRQDHYECVVLFLARGADVEGKNNGNEVPIQCCQNESSPVWLALRVNKQLKGFAAARLGRMEKLVHRDVSMGRENIPIAVVNGIDDDLIPTDFQYITENVESIDLSINRTISSLQSCRCSDNCSSMFCVCGRNSVKCWYDRGCRLLPDFNMLEPPLIFECNKGCRCWSTCNNRVVQMGIASRLQMMKTDGRGWGVKSLLNVPKGMFICEYIGELISDSEADSREDDSYLFDLDNRDGDTYCIDARRYGNISRFINHLCEPNLIPVKVFVEHQDLRFPRICFFSSREIKAHEELGFDYGEKFWMIKWKQFTCACGTEKCKYSNETIHKTLEEYHLRHEDEGNCDGGTT